MFKPGFFGINPQRWFIGQVPLNQVENKVSKVKWGDRVKVRIMGYHPKDGDILKDDDLPWAIVLKPTSQGSLNRGSTAIVGGEWVIGIFLDDDYENGIAKSISNELNLKSCKPIYTLGLKEKSAGFYPAKDNLPTNKNEIIKKIKKIINEKK